MGFKKSDVVWTRTTFDTAIAPGAKDWDMNIQQFGVTDERKKVLAIYLRSRLSNECTK